MNTLEKFEARQTAKLLGDKKIPDFAPGDTVNVKVKVREGSRERIQAYEGVCIGRHGKVGDINASFTVRKISLGEGVERVFPLYSPRIDSIELVRRGSVRRAKLYYLRDRRGKSARISERTTGYGMGEEDEAGSGNIAEKPAKQAKTKAAPVHAQASQEAENKAESKE